jgi:tetratricopeptide (TPR) repeat protein
VDTRSARRAFEQGEQLRKRGRKAEAIQAYQAAVESDPGHFSAQFNLGLLSMEQGDLATALRAFEAASRIEPASAPARYNFALVLKSGGYPVDSANELLILLGQDPDDVRGHLTLGNLYAQQFGDKGKARAHYVRVLELDPGHPQAGSIHFWLVQNPP